MNKCDIPSLYDSLDFCPGKTSMPGIRPKVYFIPKRLILEFPALPELDAEGLSMGAVAVLVGDFKLAADAKFMSLDALSTASNITSASQGEMPSKSFLNSCTLKHAGTGEDATGFCRLANIDDLVYIVQQRDGKYRVIGNDKVETDTKPSQDSGMAVTDASGTTLEISVSDICPSPFYTGKLPTADGVLDCSTGKLTVEAGD